MNTFRLHPRAWTFTIVFGVAFVMIVFFARTSEEPMHRGKPLSHWVAKAYPPGGTEQALAELAIKAIGTNSIPLLIRYVNATNAKWKKKVHEIAGNYFAIKYDYTHAEEFHARALQAFQILGKEGRSAIPPLIESFDNRADNMEIVAWALTGIGEESIGPVCAALRSKSTRRRNGAVRALGHLVQSKKTGTGSEQVMEKLADILNSNDSEWKAEALYALGSFQDRAKSLLPTFTRLASETDYRVSDAAIRAILSVGPDEASIPILTKALLHQDHVVRRRAAEHLGKFGTEAKIAVTALLQNTNHLQVGVREAVSNALQQIEAYQVK
jgi:hypothetical protein